MKKIKKGKTIEDYISLPYFCHIEIINRQQKSIIYPELPGCMTIIPVHANQKVAATELLKTWLEQAIRSGYPIPEPTKGKTEINPKVHDF